MTPDGLPWTGAPLRDAGDLRRAISDAVALTDGMGPAATAARLSPPGLATWLLDALAATAAGGIHRYSQQFMTADLDGPALLARVGEAVRPLDAEVADFCRWVAARGAVDRASSRNEPFTSVVNRVGAVVSPALAVVAGRVAEGWPDDLAVASLPPPPPRPRSARAASTLPRFKRVAIGLTSVGAGCALRASPGRGVDHVLDVVAVGLWRAGAADRTLDRAMRELVDAKDRLPEALAAWVCVDGDGGSQARFEALRAAWFPAHPIEAVVGGPLEPFLGFVRIDDERFDDAAGRLSPAHFVVCVTDRGRSAAEWLRSALRVDADGVVVRAAELAAPDEVELLLRAALTGHVVVVSGTSPALEAALASVVRQAALPVRDRRGATR